MKKHHSQIVMRISLRLLILCFLLIDVVTVHAQQAPVFTPLRVLRAMNIASFCDTVLSAKKYHPVIAADTVGRGVMAWLDERDGLRDVYVRFFEGGEFQAREMKVNDHLQGASNVAPAVASNARGEGVLVWKEFTSHLRYRRFTTDGVLIPAESGYIENRHATFLGSPSVAVAPDGSFLVSWEEYTSIEGYAVRARVFRPDATPVTESLLLAEFMPRWETGYQRTDENGMRAAVDAGGRYCVVWLDFVTFNQAKIHGVVLDASGNTVGAPAEISLPRKREVFFRAAPQVHRSGSGGFFVNWYESDLSTSTRRLGWSRLGVDGTVLARDTIAMRSNEAQFVGIAPMPDGSMFVIHWDDSLRCGTVNRNGEFRAGPAMGYAISPPFFQDVTQFLDIAAMPDGNIAVAWPLMKSMVGRQDRTVAYQLIAADFTPRFPAIRGGTDRCSKDELRPLVARNDRNDILVTWEHGGALAPTIAATICDTALLPSGRQLGMPAHLNRQPLRLFKAHAFPGDGGGFVVLRGESAPFGSYSPSLATLGRDASAKLGPVSVDPGAWVLDAGMTVDAAGNIHVLYLTTEGELRRCLFSPSLERLEENRTIYSFTVPAPEHLNRIAIAMHPDARAVVSIASGPYRDHYYPLAADTLVTVVFDRNGAVLDQSIRRINAVPQGYRHLRNAIAADGRIAVMWNDVLSTGRHLLRIERHDAGSAVARDSSAFILSMVKLRPVFATLRWTDSDEVLATWAQNSYFKAVLIDDTFARVWPMQLHGMTTRENQYFEQHLAHDVLVIDSTLYLFHESNAFSERGYDIHARTLRLPSREIELPESFTFDVTPMPVAAAAALRFTLGEDVSVRATLHDLLGREVRSLDYGMLPRGVRRIMLPTDGLSSGVYICTVRAGQTAVRPLLIVR